MRYVTLFPKLSSTSPNDKTRFLSLHLQALSVVMQYSDRLWQWRWDLSVHQWYKILVVEISCQEPVASSNLNIKVKHSPNKL